MSEVYTALLVILAIHNGAIEKKYELALTSAAQCETAKQEALQEANPPGYTFKIYCLTASDQQI